MQKSDSYFEVGTNHPICQDYALHGRLGDLHYVIGSDGCSSAKDSDVGSRLLSHVAKSVLALSSVRMLLDCNVGSEKIYKHIEEQMLHECKKLREQLSLPSEIFDATLLIGFCYKDLYYYFVWGDGVVVITHPEGRQVVQFNYEDNAPQYLSYAMDERRAQAYTEQFSGICTKTLWTVSLDKSKTTQLNCVGSEKYTAGILAMPGTSLSLFSDGIISYSGEENVLLAMADRFTSYKSFNGEFVKRRMLWVKRELDKSTPPVTHYDDIFCATLRKDVEPEAR